MVTKHRNLDATFDLYLSYYSRCLGASSLKQNTQSFFFSYYICLSLVLGLFWTINAMSEKTESPFADSGHDSAHDTETPIKTSSDEPGKLEEGTVGEEKAAPVLGEKRGITGFKWFLAVIAILSSTFLFALDTTVVSFIPVTCPQYRYLIEHCSRSQTSNQTSSIHLENSTNFHGLPQHLSFLQQPL